MTTISTIEGLVMFGPFLILALLIGIGFAFNKQ
jgi:hypothetical protein